MSNQIVSKAVGIDLGTTNSAVAIMNPTDTDIVIHRDNIAKRETTPSCVWKNPKTHEIVVGHRAFRLIGTSPKPITSIKRSMGTQSKVMLTDEEVTPEKISSHILAEMKRQIEEDIETFNTEQTTWIIDRAIITVPAYFDQPQIDATRKAGEMVGLEVLDLLHEPTAAACHYCWKTSMQNGVFLVYDLGGGTFDVSILRSTSGIFEVLGTSGNNRLGGDDFDTVLAYNLQERLIREGYDIELNIKENPEDELRFNELKFLAESVKKALSSSGEFLLRNTTLQDKEGTRITIETMYERPEVEELFKPIIDRTIPYCFEALELANKKSGITLADVDAIILAGGSTHIPLVREIVKNSLCADPEVQESRAKCDEPIYDKVDTIVALGAAIRAAAVGSLSVFNKERTVRVSFRGTGAAGTKDTYIGGNVKAIGSNLDLTGGRIHLTISDLEYDDEDDLDEAGNFRFRKIPLQPSAENLLNFEIYDNAGTLVAKAERPITQTKEAKRPTGGSGSTAVLSKAISLDVMREGKEYRKELIPATTTLPANENFVFSHPGKTELIRLPLYQQKKKIQEIIVNVPKSLPKGTPLEMNLNIDQLSFITVKGKIGDTTFDAPIELPEPRKMPTREEIDSLEKSFQESITYLQAGKRNLAEARYKKAKKSFEVALNRDDEEQAIHEFEEMEDIVSEISRAEGPLKPPKEFFDDLVAECYEINQYTARAAAESGHPHDHTEIAKAIDAQHVQGEKSFSAGDQKAYSDAILMLENIRNHVIALAQKVQKIEDTRPEGEKAEAQAQHAGEEASKVSKLAASQNLKDQEKKAKQIEKELEHLAKDAQKNPKSVQEKVGKLRSQLEKIKNIVLGKRTATDDGELVEDNLA